MIYYKLSFLMILISVVCISAAVKTPKEALQDHRDCYDDVEKTFSGFISTPLNCVRHGIRSMKLHGNNAILYNKHLETYYKLFYKSVKIDSVLLPEKYCNKNGIINKDCLRDLLIFLKPPTFSVITDGEEEIEEGTSQSNPIILDSITGQNNPSSSQNIFHTKEYLDNWINSDGWPLNDDQQIIEDEDSEPPVSERVLNKWLDSDNWDDFQQIIKGGQKRRQEEDSEPPVSKSILRRNALKNALYLHVMYDPTQGHLLPRNLMSRKYFHQSDSFGYFYLAEMALNIELKKGSLSDPYSFCNAQYTKDLEEIRTYRREHGQH